MTTIVTGNSIYAIDAATGDFVNIPERGGRAYKNEHKPYKPTPLDIEGFKYYDELQKEKQYFAWLEDEHYRVSNDYRIALIKEIQQAKKVSSDISLDLPIIMDALQQIKVPKYNEYKGDLSKEKQLKFYNKMSKPNFTLIFSQTIKENL